MVNKLRICFFGHYNPDYSRNRIIIKALKRLSFDLLEAQSSLKRFARYSNLFRMVIKSKFDILWVGFLGHTDVPIAKIISIIKNSPLIFDAFVSLYESSICDRKIKSAKSLYALKMRFVDWLACKLAKIILLDTQTHIDYFVNSFKIPNRKFKRLWLGADDELMFPRSDISQQENFTVFFYGSFIPLQGIEYIVQAAHILETKGNKVDFIIVGSGQTFQDILCLTEKLKIKSIKFMGWLPYNTLPELICNSSLCLGIFGATLKANRVIPNKVFDAIACARPVITADTPAIHEAFTHGENIYLIPKADPLALANAILMLKKDKSLRVSIAKKGYELFKQNFSIEAISKNLNLIIQELMDMKLNL